MAAMPAVSAGDRNKKSKKEDRRRTWERKRSHGLQYRKGWIGMESASLLGMLGILSIEDFHKRKIASWQILAFGILGLFFHLLFQRLSIENLLGGLMIGVALLLICRLSGEQIGYGDGLLFLVTGIFLGFWDNMILLWFAAILMGLTSLFLYLIGKITKRARVPFIPFVLVAYVLLLGWRS